MSKYYPRVLLVNRTEISPFNSAGASRGGWFRDWPKDRLAHVFSARAGLQPPFTEHSYVLTGAERRFGFLFDLAKPIMYKALPTASASSATGAASQDRSLTKLLKLIGFRVVIESGLWELAFPPKLSPGLVTWAREFNPEVIVAAPSELSFVHFALLLQKELKIPIVTQVDDDWPTTFYRNSWLSGPITAMANNAFLRLLNSSQTCLTIGQAMAHEYRSRYGVLTESLMCVDTITRYDQAEPHRVGENDEFVIAYSGNLQYNRWRSLVDLLKAVQTLNREGFRIRVHVHSSTLPTDAADFFKGHDALRLLAPPHHDQVPAVLKGADLLFLTEGFDPKYHEYIRFSVSSKSQVYMMSGRPVLAYGPSTAGVIEYACVSGWAYVVDKPEVSLLAGAVRKLIMDQTLRRQLVGRARTMALANHDAPVVRERLRDILAQAALGTSGEERKADV